MTRAASPDFVRHMHAVRDRLQASGLQRPGAGSVTWKVNREVVVVAGWGPAILMQFAHPLIAAGVAEHSGFDRGLFSGFHRLFATVRAMLSLTFGDERQAVAAAAGINTIHDRVFGRLLPSAGAFPAGTPYSAHQAELLRWVHATLLRSVPATYELLVGPLSAAERDRYCEEAAIMEPLLDIPAGTLPRSAAALAAYMDSMLRSDKIVVTGRSRQLARGVLYPPVSRALWPGFRPVRLITIALLPAAIRDAYGFRWTDSERRALGRWTAAIRGSRAVLPPSLREWPVARAAGGRTPPRRLPDPLVS